MTAETARTAKARLHPLTLPIRMPCDVVALQGEEEQQDRQHGDHGARHHQFGVLHVLAGQVGERHRQGVLRSSVSTINGHMKSFQVARKVKIAERDEDRPQQRQHDRQ